MNDYVFFEPIAAGGMGTVHFGRATSGAGLSRVVAIKRMHGELARDPRCLSMFRDELRLATRVRHPNVIATLDVVEQDNELLMVMEYVQGESLQELIARGVANASRLPPAIAVSVISGILQGLEAAHEAKTETGEPLGIVHRDVSPENILVGRDGIARLLDFGIARGAGRKHVTRIGELKGKPSYLAPEQILNGGQGLDRRADVYGAAVVLWEALTGRRLFDAESVGQTLGKVLHEPVPRPSQLVPSLPQGLDDVVMRGLSREPSDRYATALDMARALRSVCGSLLPFEVAEWLEVNAKATLARQSETVRRIETSGLAQRRPSEVRHRSLLGPASAPAHDPELVATSSSVRPSARAVSAAWLAVVNEWLGVANEWLAGRPRVRRGLFGLVIATVGFAAGLVIVGSAVAGARAAQTPRSSGAAALVSVAPPAPIPLAQPAPVTPVAVAAAAASAPVALPPASASSTSRKAPPRAAAAVSIASAKAVPNGRRRLVDDGF